MGKLILAMLAMALFCGMLFAGCSERAYLSGCSSCKFDNATKKFDRSCTDAKKAEGIACLSAEYPIAMMNYRNGNCSAAEQCVQTLNTCVSAHSTGNEKADCDEGSLAYCYAGADQCFNQAAIKCTDMKSACAVPGGLIIIAGGAALWMLFLGKKAVTPALAKA